ncbi:MAG: pseudouridine synthase [Bacteriovoracaceae bacterium]
MFKYVALYKPFGHLSQFTGDEGQKTLADFGLPPNIYAVGRLDKDSEGLLLLTNDGPFKNKLSSPEFEKKKVYYVQVEGIPEQVDLDKLRKGVVIKTGKTKPAQVRILENTPTLPPRDPPIRFRKNIPTTWLEIIITEGKNRQVRRMTANIGYPTLRLVRVKIGKLELSGLTPGQWIEVRKSDVI